MDTVKSVSRVEQETIITFNQLEDTASLYTASPAIYRRMVKRGFKAEKLDDCSWTFEIPRRSVKLPSKPRVYSKEQRLEAKERLKRHPFEKGA